MSYKDQVKADRRAAAKERMRDDYRKDEGYKNIYKEEAGK